MNAFFTPMRAGVLACILFQRSEAGIDNNTDGGGSNNNIHRSSNESDASSQTSSSFTSPSSTNGHERNSNGSNKNGINDRSTYYYNNNRNDDGQRVKTKYDDEQTYLDVFGELAKELFTQHIIPFTDVECRWDWRMGRCEPYCSCEFHFLWGDFHIGRSCRLRLSPPPSQFAKGEAGGSGEEEESRWQEAWQEVWQSQMTDGTADSASSFVPPMFPKTHPASSWDETSNTCTLPPESRYIQIIRQLSTKTKRHSNIVVDQYQKLKSVTVNVANTTIIQGRHHWTNLRHEACEVVKSKVEERAKIRNQPVVLTRQGATWIRRVCGAPDGSIRRVDDDQTDASDTVEDGVDNSDKNMGDVAE